MTLHMGRPAGAGVAIVAALAATVMPAAAQWSTSYEQHYLPASHNWSFRNEYRTADRLFNAFDYGHAILYETLYRKPNAPASALEVDEYDFITKRLLVKPPRVPLEESAIEVEYAKLAPEAKIMFDWAHIFHRQIYDVWADESVPEAEKDARVAELLRYYKSRPELAFSSEPKTMELMEGQYYSTAFRKKYPRFNGLIWAYHWLQVGLYEPLIVGRTVDERQTGVTAAVTRFWQMLADAPNNMPRIMPMTAAVAPEFARRYPEAAIIFDNLHSMHDVVSDILTSPKVPREKKREEILIAAARYRDGTSFVMTEEEWREMALMIGVENMGGPAVGFLAALPEGTVPRGAVLAGMDHAAMPGMQRADSAHAHGADRNASGMPTEEQVHRMMEMHDRMMADSVIVMRMIADTALHRMMMQMMEHMRPEQRALMQRLMRTPAHRHDVPEPPAAKRPAASAWRARGVAILAAAPARAVENHAATVSSRAFHAAYNARDRTARFPARLSTRRRRSRPSA